MKLFSKGRIKLGDRIGRKMMGEVWDNKRERSFILLLLWLVFFAFVFLYIFLSPQNKTSNNNMNDTLIYQNVNDMLGKLKDKTCYYDIAVYDSKNLSFTYYTGNKSIDSDSGIMKNNDMEINYHRLNNVYVNDENNIITSLFDDTLMYFISDDNLLNFIEQLPYEESYENELKVYKYKSNYNNIIINITIKSTIKDITYIGIDYQNFNYKININS